MRKCEHTVHLETAGPGTSATTSPTHIHGRGRDEFARWGIVDVIPQLYSAKHLAERLDVSVNLIYKLAGEGEIPSFQIGGLRRFREDEVLAWIDEHSEGKGLAEVRELRSVS